MSPRVVARWGASTVCIYYLQLLYIPKGRPICRGWSLGLERGRKEDPGGIHAVTSVLFGLDDYCCFRGRDVSLVACHFWSLIYIFPARRRQYQRQSCPGWRSRQAEPVCTTMGGRCPRGTKLCSILYTTSVVFVRQAHYSTVVPAVLRGFTAIAAAS